MENLIERMYRRTSVPWLKLFLTVVITFLSCLGLVVLASETGFHEWVTEHRGWLYLASGVAAIAGGSLFYGISSGRQLRLNITRLEGERNELKDSLMAEKAKTTSLSSEVTRVRKDLAEASGLVYGLVRDQTGRKEFEIAKAGYDGDCLYISVRKRKGVKLDQGKILAVVHKSDNMFMGRFEIAEERAEVYYARATSNINAVWAGFIKQEGEVSLMPHLAAICIPNGERDAKETAAAR